VQQTGAGDDRRRAEPYARWDVPGWEEVRDEPVGVTTKYWLKPPGIDDEAEEWL
jgi:hypothetical protein